MRHECNETAGMAVAVLRAFLPLALASSMLAADAESIMRAAFERTMSRSVRYDGSLVRFHPNGHVHRRSRWRVERTGEPGAGRIKLTYLAPEELAGVQLLVHCRRGEQANQWLYTPATDRARPVRPGVRGRRFYSTDFTFDDLQEADATLESFRLAGQDALSGEACWRIEAPAAEGSPYDRKIFWVSKQRQVIVQADHFIGSNHVKRMAYSGYRERQGAWIPDQVDAIDVYTGWRTVLVLDESEIDVAFAQDAFEPESLGLP